MEIRKAIQADAPALAELLRRTGWWPAMNAEPPEIVAERVAGMLALDLVSDCHSVYVAEGDTGNVLGFTAVHWLPYLFLRGPEGFVSELFVHPEARGVNIGARLLEAIQADAQSRGCVRLSLLNGKGRESYERRFYEKHGWQERGMMANFVRVLSE